MNALNQEGKKIQEYLFIHFIRYLVTYLIIWARLALPWIPMVSYWTSVPKQYRH